MANPKPRINVPHPASAQYLSIKHLAKRMDVSHRTAYEIIQTIPGAFKFGHQWRISERDLATWLEKRQVHG